MKLTSLLIILASTLAAQIPAVDWAKQNAETLRHYRALVPFGAVLKASRTDTEMFRVLEQAAHQLYPGAAVMPTMLTAATDMAQLRAKGIQSYGIGPAATAEDRTNYGAHSDVERLLES